MPLVAASTPSTLTEELDRFDLEVLIALNAASIDADDVLRLIEDAWLVRIMF